MIVTTLGRFVVVYIHKPMSVQPDYDFCRVRRDYFDVARRKGFYVLVRTPNGERVIMPKAMKDFKIVKEVFLIPTKPMELYEIVVPHCQKQDDDKNRFS